MAAVVAVSFIASPSLSARGHPLTCFDYGRSVKELRENFGEIRQAAGIVVGGRFLVELWASADGATWSVLIVDTQRKICHAYVGERWTVFGAPVIRRPGSGEE